MHGRIVWFLVLCAVLTGCQLRPPPASRDSAPLRTPTQTSHTNDDPNAFRLTSPLVSNGGTLPATFTCDGTSETLPLVWANPPATTTSYAIVMHHTAAANDVHWYWVLYDIPADVTQLAQNSTGVGSLGTNSVNDRNEYAPPCSKGPGFKTYTYTIYALSAPPQLTSGAVDRDTLLAAISDTTVASATLDVVYSRP